MTDIVWKTDGWGLPKYKATYRDCFLTDRIKEDLERGKQMMENHTDLYHKAYNIVKTDMLASIDMKFRLTPKKIIHNGPATIVIWRDGEKTVVKLMEGDTYDEYAAFTAALAKRIFGSTGYVKRTLKDVTVEQDTKITKKDLHLLAIDENSLVNLAKRILNNK